MTKPQETMDKNRQTYNNPTEIDRLTERYYAGLTSLEEERELRRLLAEERRGDDREADRAVAAYTAMMRPRRRGARRGEALRRAMRIAAAVIVGAGLTYAAIAYSPGAGDECYAMVDQRRIDDREVVMDIMEATLGEVARAQADMRSSVADQFNEISSQL